MKRSILLAMVAVACVLTLPAFAEDGLVCADCHDEVAAGMKNQIHMRIQPFEVNDREVGCVGCHGDGVAHMEEGDPTLIRNFDNESADDAQACVECHAEKNQPEWAASTHAMEGLACTDCHDIHSRNNPLNSCKSCHADVYTEFMMPNHHPVLEGKMSCSSCHDPHLATEMQLRTHTRANDLCYTCHQDKEGPFIFEHVPVVEDCSLCHLPHGSVAEALLTASEPMLCLQCHELHFHAGLLSPDGPIDVGGTERESPWGEHSMNLGFTSRCSQCHSQIHGTDLPSQTVPGGGHGMVR
ncbi:MAG: DmsE family decaheme c-type cytochrome [Thermoanaerobaculales bacterium]|nr:DmsE family decaheme c-type cytochrome [Thermoanaerobaculales bacterium]